VHLTQKDQIITFVNRNLEPSRGYHSFMRALPQIQQENPNAKVLIIGGDGVSYGKKPDKGTWKQQFLDEVKSDLDLSRIHFLGKVPYDVYINAIRLSSCHVYLTSPFVLSWSMLESMSLGAPILGSSTQPVVEVIEHEKNGWLVDFFNYENIAKMTTHILSLSGDEIAKVTTQARKTVIEKYDLDLVCLPKHIELVEGLVTDAIPINHH
ncbi:MAG: glycosyltransferase, partial [Glaciecola sp.]